MHPGKQNYGRQIAPRETVRGTAPKGNAKTLRQKGSERDDTSESAARNTAGKPKGQPAAGSRQMGISREKTEAERQK